MRVLICGGGVIGACTAWFLARRGVDVVVERTEEHLPSDGSGLQIKLGQYVPVMLGQ